MTLNKDIINQTNRSHLNQPLNQMKLSPFHIHVITMISLQNRPLQTDGKI